MLLQIRLVKERNVLNFTDCSQNAYRTLVKKKFAQMDKLVQRDLVTVQRQTHAMKSKTVWSGVKSAIVKMRISARRKNA